jgi:PAS domain S-box-containing protein
MPSPNILKQAIDSLSAGFVILDSNGTIEFMDQTVREELGHDEDDATYTDWFGHVVPEDARERARQEFQQYLNSDPPPEEIATPVRTINGTQKSVVWKQIVSDEDSSHIIGRLVSAERLEPSISNKISDPYHTLVKHFPNGLVTLFDDELRFRIVGGHGFDKLGISPEDLRGNRLHEALPKANAAALQPLYKAALEGEINKTALTLENRIFEILVVPLRDNAGNVVAGMTVSQDVTEREQQKRELEQAHERYHALIENAPVPIVVCNETGEIVEVNEQVERLIGRSRDELLGNSQTLLHPEGEEDRYVDLFDAHIVEGGTRRYLADGQQIYVATDTGETIPVEISVSTLEWEDGQLAHGIFRDISEQVWYENTLEEIHRNSENLLAAETESEIAQAVVDAAIDILELQLVSVNLFDPDEETLEPVAYSDDVPTTIGQPPSLPIRDSVAGESFLSNETIRIDDVRSHEHVYNPQTNIRSQLIVPFNEFGVIICGHPDPAEFTSANQRLLELLARNAEAVLERIQREQELRHHEQDLAEQTRELQQVEKLNDHIRKLTQIAIQAEHRIELEQGACDLFVTNDSYTFIWCGEPSTQGTELVPQIWAGDDQGYLDSVRLELDGNTTEPAVQTAQTKDVTVVSNIARDVQGNPWRREAIRRGFRSAISVPIVYQDALYGVLTIYSTEQETFTERVQRVLQDWGDLMGYSLNQIEKTSAVISTRGTVLQFELKSRSCPLLRLAQECQCILQFGGLRQQEGQRSQAYVRILDQVPEQFQDVIRGATGISSVTPVKESSDSSLFKIEFSEPFIATALAKYGIRLQNISGIENGVANIRVTTPQKIPVHRTVEIVSLEYPEATLLDTKEVEEVQGPLYPYTEQILSRLTEQQQEAIELAYHGGYFDSPKGLTGEELANKMNISSSAYHNHLRAAEREILRAIIGSYRGDVT